MNDRGWWSQPFAPEGSAASEGIKKQLGVPRMDPLAVLVRESAQNSWDARRFPERVTFAVDITRPGRAALDRWGSLLLPEPSGHGAFGLADLLTDGDPTILTISDRGTTGLGGPLRADMATAETPDFVNLVRNIGEPRDKTYGGGTYGFGKGVLFTASSVGTVLIRTRCVWQGRPQTRLIGVALGHSYTAEDRRHTGRHWWGRIVGDIPDPLLNQEADDVARHLGFPPMADEELGTDIVIMGARLGSTFDAADPEHPRPRTTHEAGEFIASSMLWHLWPLLLPRADGRFVLRCEVRADGHPIRVPDPRQVVRLRPFVEAYIAVSEGRGQPVDRQRPPTRLGLFAAQAHMAPTRRAPEDVAAPFDGNGQHCVLMREPKLVVRYVEGTPLADEMLHYGAVFVADRHLDSVFAAAEPPTHDDWVHDSLPDRDDALLVRYTLRRVKDLVQEFSGSTGSAGMSGGDQPPLGALSGRLGSLLPTANGTGADGSGGGGRRGDPGSRGRRQVKVVDGPRLVRAGDNARIVATLEADRGSHRIAVRIRPLVALDRGSESDPPAGADAPEVTEIRSEDAGIVLTGDLLTIEPGDPRRWIVVIRPAAGAVTRLQLDVEEGGVR